MRRCQAALTQVDGKHLQINQPRAENFKPSIQRLFHLIDKLRRTTPSPEIMAEWRPFELGVFSFLRGSPDWIQKPTLMDQG
jgi:hypothetical protein